jgi:hypothetical protein
MCFLVSIPASFSLKIFFLNSLGGIYHALSVASPRRHQTPFLESKFVKCPALWMVSSDSSGHGYLRRE